MAEKGFLSGVTTLFGKSCFEQKLKTHGVKVKLSKSSKRSIQQISQTSPLMLFEELSLLTVEKLKELAHALNSEIKSINSEMLELQEEKVAMATENEELKKESKALEEKVKKMLRPWINRYPHSDELTRAYLIN